jgi:histone H3/H4
METFYRRCSTCKQPIAFESQYFACSVSTCNHKRTGLFFCSVPCWDAHVPGARHRDAWAIAQTAPSRAELVASETARAARVPSDASPENADPARRRVVSPAVASRTDAPAERSAGASSRDDHDVLVVVSKLKQYIRSHAGMNTSDNVSGVLSDHLRELCREAIRVAAGDDRKTVMNRDFSSVLERLFRR